MGLKRTFLLLLGLIAFLSMQAQPVTWPSPEVEQMYKDARQFHSRGNLKEAITLYKQAIQIAPDIMLLHRELGQALYLSGAYEEAISTLDAVVQNGAADEETYQIMASGLAAKGEKKKARSILKAGIERYPHSGMLYQLSGKLYSDEGKPEEALQAWLSGIENDPAYHINYYEAARAYSNTNKIVWAILYGEMFINIEQQTPRSQDVRKMLLEAYKSLFRQIGSGEVAKYGSVKYTAANDFEQAVYNTYVKLSPVVSDGMTTENLIMLRTRFMMDWEIKKYKQRYPFSLFTRQDDMIRNGYFDIYNQWLFGKAENKPAYEAWVKFHSDAMPELEDYLKKNPYRPVGGDFYNNRDMPDNFKKKKKG